MRPYNYVSLPPPDGHYSGRFAKQIELQVKQEKEEEEDQQICSMSVLVKPKVPIYSKN